MHRHILYVAYGADCFVQEAAYSILSLWRQGGIDDYRVTVVTDRGQSLRRWLGVDVGMDMDRQAPSPTGLTVLHVQPEQFTAWRGDRGYVHRAKPLAIHWAMTQILRATGAGDAARNAVLFVDSDTVFTRSPAPLFDAIAQGSVVLDVCEGGLAESRRRTSSHRKLYRANQRRTFAVRGRQRHFAPDTQLWNSGVIGLSGDKLDVFDETVALIDDLYPAARIKTVEQVALSVVLQDRGARLQDCGGVLYHYYDFKEFRQDLALFFDRYADAPLAQRLAHWPEIDPVLRGQPKRVFKAQPKWRRQLLQLVGRRWRPLPYPWI